MIAIHEPIRLLGDLSPTEFMQEYWQRKPLLIRQAIPNFTPPISIKELKTLSKNTDIESRLIVQEDQSWHVSYGPFEHTPKDTQPNWTLLLQGMNLHHDGIAQLMQAFRFIPDARLDDVMISIATQGGGVGPHFDSYDVFLLQGVGQRRWRIGQTDDLSLREDVPLKILKHFEPQEEYILNPGDMLYLPPHYAHDGIAENDCMTISIGFRSPSHQELLAGVLDYYLQELNQSEPIPALQAHYQDPQQPAVTHAAEIPSGLIRATQQTLQHINLDEQLIHRFLGCWLSEPKTHVFFNEPEELDIDLCEEWPEDYYLTLDRRTQMLYRDGYIFINGEIISHSTNPKMEKLADQRFLALNTWPAEEFSAVEREWLQVFIESGWAHLSSEPSALK